MQPGDVEMADFEMPADADIRVDVLNISQQGECGVAYYAFRTARQVRTHGEDSVEMHLCLLSLKNNRRMLQECYKIMTISFH